MIIGVSVGFHFKSLFLMPEIVDSCILKRKYDNFVKTQTLFEVTHRH